MQKILLWGLLLLLNYCSIVESELENNDTPIQALSHKIFNAPINIQGTFKSINDKDYYPIYIEQSGYYSIAVSQAKGFDIKLSILDNNTKPIIIADDYYKNFGEQVPSIFLEKQLYYILVESKFQKYSSAYDNTNPNYTLMVQPFAINTKEKIFSLGRNGTHNLESLQTIYPDIPHYGFFQPTDDPSIQNPLIERLVKYIAKKKNKEYKPYKIEIYTFDVPQKQNMILNLELSSVYDVDSAVAIFNIKAFRSILNTGKAHSSDFSLIVDNHGYEEEESIINQIIPGKTRYILILIGSNRLNYKSFLEARNNFYTLQFSLTPKTIKKKL